MMQRAQRSLSTLLFCLILMLSLALSNCRMSEQTPNTQTTNSSRPSLQKASDPLSIHRRAISIDMHADTTQRMVDEQLDINQRLADGQLDAMRMREGGLDAQFFSIWVEPQLYGGGGEKAIRRADEQIEAVRALAEKY